MAQSAILGFGLAPQIKGLGGGVDRKWQGVGVKKEYAGKSKGIRVPLHRRPPALRCAPNQKPLQRWPRVQEPIEAADAEVGERGPQLTYNKASLADPPQGVPRQQFNPNVGYPPQIDPQQYSPQQPNPQQIYPPQQPDPQQYIYRPQQPNSRSPRESKRRILEKLMFILVDISGMIVNGFSS